MFIVFEGVMTNINGAERIYKQDPPKNMSDYGFRIEFEGGIRLGTGGKKYIKFADKEERDRVYENIKAEYGVDVFGKVENEGKPATVPEGSLPPNDAPRRGRPPKGEILK